MEIKDRYSSTGSVVMSLSRRQLLLVWNETEDSFDGTGGAGGNAKVSLNNLMKRMICDEMLAVSFPYTLTHLAIKMTMDADSSSGLICNCANANSHKRNNCDGIKISHAPFKMVKEDQKTARIMNESFNLQIQREQKSNDVEM